MTGSLLFFWSWSTLAGPQRASTAWATVVTRSAPHRVLPFFPAFLAGMNLVVLADDAFTFLLCWEFMSLASWALVMAHHREPGNTRAGYIYLVMASFGTLALLLAFGLLSGTAGSYAFAAIRAAEHSQSSGVLVLILMLLGAGSKAGLVPLHVWLPLAHPAAPSHVSALMSGVMTKVAVYAFIRVVFDLLGPPAWSWSIVVLLPRGRHGRPGHPVRLDGEGSQTAARLLYDRERRHHICRPWSGAGVPGQRTSVGSGAGVHRRTVPRPQPLAVQKPAVLCSRRRADLDWLTRYRSLSAA